MERRRVVRALEYLEEQGWAMLKVADVRQRYTRGRETEDAEALAFDLASRFLRREQAEVARLRRVLDLVTLRRLPDQCSGRLLRRKARGALRPLHLLPHRPPCRPAPNRRTRNPGRTAGPPRLANSRSPSIPTPCRSRASKPASSAA